MFRRKRAPAVRKDGAWWARIPSALRIACGKHTRTSQLHFQHFATLRHGPRFKIANALAIKDSPRRPDRKILRCRPRDDRVAPAKSRRTRALASWRPTTSNREQEKSKRAVWEKPPPQRRATIGTAALVIPLPAHGVSWHKTTAAWESILGVSLVKATNKAEDNMRSREEN